MVVVASCEIGSSATDDGSAHEVCAGISNSRIVLWHYLPNKWNGELAAETYRGPIMKVLKAERGEKRKYRVLEDNDPTGYKSNKAIDAKKDLHIEAIHFPTYSPDLNPLDYSLWEAVEATLVDNASVLTVSVDVFREGSSGSARRGSARERARRRGAHAEAHLQGPRDR